MRPDQFYNHNKNIVQRYIEILNKIMMNVHSSENQYITCYDIVSTDTVLFLHN